MREGEPAVEPAPGVAQVEGGARRPIQPIASMARRISASAPIPQSEKPLPSHGQEGLLQCRERLD
jgi:hypothetical protein